MASLSRLLLALAIAAIFHMTDVQAQSSSIHVVTYLDIAPASFAKAKPLLLRYREASAKEPGSGGAIELYQEIGRPGRIVVRETWATQSAFETHGKAAAAATLASGLKSFELAPPDQRVHHDFASGSGVAKAGNAAVHVFSHVDVPPPRQPDLEPALRALQAASTNAATAVRFNVLQQSSRKNHFTVVETWTSLKALHAQALSPAQREFRDKLGPMLGALYDQRLYKALM